MIRPSSPSRATSSRSSVRSGDLRLAGGGAERGEIVPAQQRLRRRMHRRGIERRPDMPDPAGLQRRPGAAVEDAVAVARAATAENRAFQPVGRQRRAAARRPDAASCGSSARRAAGRGGIVVGPGRAAPPGPRHARRHRCGRRRRWPAGTPRSAAPPLPPAPAWTERPLAWRCQPTNGRAVVFQRQGVARHQPSRRPGRHRRSRAGTPPPSIAAAPGRCTRVSRSAPSPQATVSRVVQHRAGRARALGRLSRQHLQIAAAQRGERAGPRIERAHLALERCRRRASSRSAPSSRVSFGA